MFIENNTNIVKVIGVRACMQYVEAHVKVMRNTNELRNLQQETENYVAYYLEKGEATQRSLQITLDAQQASLIREVPETSSTCADIDEDNNNRYIASTAVEVSTPSFHSGLCAVLKKSKDFFDLQIGRAHDCWGERFAVLRTTPVALGKRKR